LQAVWRPIAPSMQEPSPVREHPGGAVPVSASGRPPVSKRTRGCWERHFDCCRPLPNTPLEVPVKIDGHEAQGYNQAKRPFKGTLSKKPNKKFFPKSPATTPTEILPRIQPSKARQNPNHRSRDTSIQNRGTRITPLKVQNPPVQEPSPEMITAPKRQNALPRQTPSHHATPQPSATARSAHIKFKTRQTQSIACQIWAQQSAFKAQTRQQFHDLDIRNPNSQLTPQTPTLTR